MKQKIISFGGPPHRAPSGQAQARSAVNKKRKRKRTGRHTLHYLLILVVAAAIMAILSLTVFFRIEEVDVVGTVRYAETDLLASSGVKIGDNLFRVSEKTVSKRLSEKFPYIASVSLKRHFPPRLTIEVKQEEILGAAKTETGYTIIGRSGKLLETGVAVPEQGVTIVTGMYLSALEVGRVLGEKAVGEITLPKDVEPVATTDSKGKKRSTSTIEAEEKKIREEAAIAEHDNFGMLENLVDAVAATDFDKITLVDFSDQLNMMLVYDNRLIIELGSQADLDYKLKFVKKLIGDVLEPDFEGVLDASNAAVSKEVWQTPCKVQDELVRRGLAESPVAVEETENLQENPDALANQEEPTSTEQDPAPQSSEIATPDQYSEDENLPEEENLPIDDDYAVIPKPAATSSQAA